MNTNKKDRIVLFDKLDSLFEKNNSFWAIHESEQYDEWRSPLWEYCGWLKTEPEFSNLSAQTACRLVERWMKARGKRWRDFPEVPDDEEGRTGFIHDWIARRFNAGEDPLEAAFKKALKEPIYLEEGEILTRGYHSFVSTVYWLQILTGDRNIFLPCDRLGKLMNCSARTISRYRQFAIGHGFLEPRKPHFYAKGHGGNRATEFRFNLQMIERTKPLGSA